MTVSDMDRAIDFYSRVLTFEKVSDVEVAGRDYELLQGVFGARMRVVRMRLGQERIELTEYLAPRGRPFPVGTRANDRWFQHVAIIVRDMDATYARLRAVKVEHASSGPQRLPDWNPNAGGIRAFYFRDPDGHFLEVLQFPPGKGAARWHASSGPQFLGIDHSAIVVWNTEASLKFYRDELGMQVAGESDNYGTEQEHLNNVFGAHLRITALRAPSGPGVELLEYLAPRDGLPAPADLRANDIAHWEITMGVANLDEAARHLDGDNHGAATAPAVKLPDAALGFSRGVRLRDPDGHTIRLVDRQ